MNAPTPQPRPLPIRALIAPVTPLQQNCTIVWCVKTMKAAIIDPVLDFTPRNARTSTKSADALLMILMGGIGASGGLLQRRLDLPDAAVVVLQGIIFVCILASETLYGRSWAWLWRFRAVEGR